MTTRRPRPRDPLGSELHPAARPFLTARWTNLFLANYAVDPALLRKRLPPGLDLDLMDGQAFCSLVGFDFTHVRVNGISWPGFRSFPEFNLRFYVRHGDRRGVVFVREFVPQWFVAWVARTVYNEPYSAAEFASATAEDAAGVRVVHRFRVDGRWQSVTAAGTKPGFVPDEGSVEHFFKEHSWGFGVGRGGKTLRYEVRHPRWTVYPVTEYEIAVDWELLYGPEWAVLNGVRPASTVLAAGSEIAVYPHGGV